MPESREFHIADILSVTTGLLMAPRGIEAMYELLGFMTGENLFTHQLPRACDECAPELERQHPDLRTVELPREFVSEAQFMTDEMRQRYADRWVAEQVTRFGETRTVSPLPDGARVYVDPLTELQRMAPAAKVLVVVADGSGGQDEGEPSAESPPETEGNGS